MRIVVAYDDFDAGTRAKQLTDGVARDWRGSCAVESSLWKFDVIGIRQMRELAVSDAIVADCVIVATCGDEKLPPAVTGWIDRWFAERTMMPAILMALVTSEKSSEVALDSNPAYLGQMAARRGMNFVCHAGDWEESATRTIGTFLRSRMRPGTSRFR